MRSIHVLLGALLFISSLSLPSYGIAAVVEFSFEGSVIAVGQPQYGINPAIGSVVTGSFGYDTSFVPSTPIPNLAFYQIPTPYSLVVNIDGNRIESGGLFGVTLNTIPSNITQSMNVGVQPAVVNGTVPTPDVVLGLTFASFSSTSLANLLLPDHLDLNDFDAAHYGVVTRTNNNNEQIQFTITSLTPVPLPGAGLMLVTGLGILASAVRRRAKDTRISQ